MKIVFYKTFSGRCPIEEFIEDLPREDQARFTDVYRGIVQFGFDCPRVEFKPLRGKLWEIKFKAPSGGYRVAYIVIEGDKMIWLHVFKKKTQKTPLEDLELALKRMKEIMR